MDPIEISRVSQLVEMIEKNQSRFCRDQHFLYRGEGSLNYTLLPSVYRKNEKGFDLYISNKSELKILNEFMTDAASYINLSPDDMFRWLQYAQHYGVPTRLMDWSSNPLVALFFACNTSTEMDGRVYVLNSFGYRLLTGENDINHMDGKLIKDEAMKMIMNSEDSFPYPALFKPYYFDQRMYSQSSQFMVWGYKKEPLNEIIASLEDTLGKRKDSIYDISMGLGVTLKSIEELDILSEIRVRGSKKPEILRQLDMLGVNQGTLFPGLDGIGRAVEWRNNSRNQ